MVFLRLLLSTGSLPVGTKLVSNFLVHEFKVTHYFPVTVLKEHQEGELNDRTTATKFCYSNGEAESQYRSHQLKNSSGLVTCPVLRSFVCPICKATGDFAHTQR